MSVANIKQEPIDSFDVDVKNDSYGNAAESSGHVAVMKGDNSKPINQDEMLHVMSIINRCEQESVSPESEDARTNGQFTVNGYDGEYKHECSICNARFKSARAFRGHGVIHRLGFDPIKRRMSSSDLGHDAGQYCRKNGFDDSPFKCDNCHAVFGSRDTYAMHMLMRAKDENCKARAQILGIDVDSSSSPGQLTEGVTAADGLYNVKDMSNDSNKLFPKYKGLMPTKYVSSCSDSREMLACTQCGEVFPSKDTLAMHAMFHTHDKEQHDKSTPRWAIVYSSPVAGLVRSPNSSLGRSPNPVLVQSVTPDASHSSDALNSSRKLDDGHEYSSSGGVSNSSMADQGLDLSLSSPRGVASASASGSCQKQGAEKGSEAIGGKLQQDDGTNGDDDSEGEPSTQLSKREGMNALLSYSLKSPEALSQPRAVSADSGATRLQAQGDITAKMDTSTAKNLNRPKSTDCTLGRKDLAETNQQHVSSKLSGGMDKPELVALPGEHQTYIMNRMRQLRKSRYPMRKLPYGYPPLSRPWRLPERKHAEENSVKPEVSNYTAINGCGASGSNQGIAQMLNLKAKDLSYCRYCEIVYLDRTLYQLHMGLHNVNNPWQCNACGKVCGNRLDFSSHVLHY